MNLVRKKKLVSKQLVKNMQNGAAVSLPKENSTNPPPKKKQKNKKKQKI